MQREPEPMGGIPGCFRARLPLREDERGGFLELFRSSWFPAAFEGEIQLNLSMSRAGVVRGLHYHKAQHDFWVLIEGSLRVVLVDLRSGSPTCMRCVTAGEAEMSSEGDCLLIPPGVAHGYASTSDSRLLYVVSRLYDGSDEFGVAWDDPALGIDWGIEQPVLSSRDRANPTVEQIDPGDLVAFERLERWGRPPLR